MKTHMALRHVMWTTVLVTFLLNSLPVSGGVEAAEIPLNERLEAALDEIDALKQQLAKLGHINQADASSNQHTSYTNAAAQSSRRAHAAESGSARGECAGNALGAFFEKLDPDGSGSVDVHALDTILQAHESVLILAESKTYQKKRGEDSSLNAEDFRAVMEELENAALVRFFGSLEIPRLLAESVQKRTSASSLKNALDPLSNFASDENARLEFARLVIQDVSAPLTARIADRLVSDEVYKDQQARYGQDKFSTMQLGPLAVFDQGLENILGPPDMDVMQAMEREHTEGETSNTEFEAFNNGTLRRVTPRQEWAKVLPQSTDGPINTFTYDDSTKMCADMMLLPIVKEAKLTKYEVVAIRLYTGPMFQEYNGLLRWAIASLDKHMEAARQAAGGELSPHEEETVLAAALLAVRKALGRRYATTIHAINSALLKLARVTPLPASRCGYRGLSGLHVPPCFLKADRFGCRGGVEGGFLSMSASKEEAMSYIRHEEGMPQLLVFSLGIINRGADISSLSYFPTEEEILLPPLSSLEVVGASSYDNASHGLVRVTPIGVNVNLKGRTIEELHAIRKDLHSQIADNGMREVTTFLAKEGAAEGSSEHQLGESISKQCEAVADTYRKHDAKAFNDDNFYSSAIQDVLMLLPWAMSLLDLHANAGIPAHELSVLSVKDATKRAAVLTICKRRGLVQGDPELQDDMGRGALARCAAEGQAEGAGLLLLSGARLEATDRKGQTPLIVACEKGFESTAAMLIDKGANINAKDNKGRTPLIVACQKSQEATAAMLIGRGADINAQDNKGQTPLLRACEKGLETTAAMLIDKGANVNAKNNFGRTPLIVACQKSQEATAAMLIGRGADINAKDNDDNTALFLAREKGLTDLEALLRSKGAKGFVTTSRNGSAVTRVV